MLKGHLPKTVTQTGGNEANKKTPTEAHALEGDRADAVGKRALQVSALISFESLVNLNILA